MRKKPCEFMLAMCGDPTDFQSSSLIDEIWEDKLETQFKIIIKCGEAAIFVSSLCKDKG